MKVKPTYQELENRIKELEASLYKSETRDFESLKTFEKQNRIWIQNSPVCTKIVDLDFNLQFMSEAGVKGLQIENIKEHYGQQYPLNFFPDSFKIPMLKNLKKVKELGVITRDAEILDINGQKTWFHSTIIPVYDENGQPDYYLVISVDITEQKEIEERLIKSEERFSQIIENSKDWVWEVNEKGLYTYASEVVENILGYKASELVGEKHFYDFTENNDREEFKNRILETFKQKETIYDFENLNISKNGDKIWLLTSASPVVDNNGKLIGYRGIDRDITKQKKDTLALLNAKEKAEESENKALEGEKSYKALFETIGDAIYIQDYDAKFIDVNRGVLDMYGYSKEELIGNTPLFVSAPGKNDLSAVFEKFDKVKQGIPQVFEFWGKRKNGEIFPKTVGQYKGTYFGKDVVIAVARDISSHIKTQQELILAKEKVEESESKFRGLFEKSGDAIVINQNGSIVDFNQAMVNLFGYHSKEEFIGVHPSQLSPKFQPDGKNSLEKVEEVLNLAVVNGTHRFEWMHEKSDGEDLLCEILVTLIKDEPDDRVFHGVIREITSYKKVEQELIRAKEKAEENEIKFKALTEQSPNAIYITDIKGDCVYVNERWLEFSGMKMNEALGKGWINALHTEDKNNISKDWYNSIKSKGKWFFEYRFMNKNGKVTWVEATAKELLNEEKKHIGYIGTNIDITERKKSEQTLYFAKEKAEESDRLKTEFINNMSHEIRTPMNGIMGFSEMLNQNDISDEKRVNFIKIIQSSGKQLLNVIDDILEISRLGTKQVKVIESNVCLNDVMFQLFSTFDIKAKENRTPLYLKKTLSDRQCTIIIDITKLNKVLSNLLENALKFTNQGFIEFGYQLKSDGIMLYVKDTGIGIEKSKHESIFERFSQAEKDLSKNVGGLGLGLSIAKENVELLGGSIQLESREGKGSTFFVTIPYKPVYNDTKESKTEPKYTILIAEDEEVNHLYLETLLNDVIDVDCKIIHVTNGEDAIVACKENKAIDLILMDLKMPILNGFEATKLIKKLCPNIPIIAQTAYSTVQDKEQAILVGCDDFISKPIRQESFKNILDKYLIIK